MSTKKHGIMGISGWVWIKKYDIDNSVSLLFFRDKMTAEKVAANSNSPRFSDDIRAVRLAVDASSYEILNPSPSIVNSHKS